MFGAKNEDPHTARRRSLEWAENALTGVEATIRIPASGHPKCPLCGKKHHMSAEQMRVLMSRSDATVHMIMCHACGGQIRVMN